MAGEKAKPTGEADVKFDADSQVKLDTAHDILQHPDKFAEIFLKAATTQSGIKEHIKSEVHVCLADTISLGVIKGLIKDQFNADWRSFMVSTGGKIALGIWSIALIILSAWIGHSWK